MQTSRDVVDSLIRNKPAERMGLDDHPWADTLRKWVKQGMPGYISRQLRCKMAL